MSIARSFVLLAALASACLLADTVTLKDGSVREGTVVEQDGEGITLEIQMGTLRGKVRIPREEIAAIQRMPIAQDPDEETAAKLAAAAQRLKGAEAAEAWVKLGDFQAQRAGFSEAAREAFAKALEADPRHEGAHRRLGHVKTAAGWEDVAAEQRAQGLVQLDQVWVRPNERAAIIDRRHREETASLQIGPRREGDAFERADAEKEAQIRAWEAEFARRERLRLQHGESLLSRYGYYAPGDGFYIGSGQTPYWSEGVGLATGDSEFFVGRVGTGFYDYGYHHPHHHGFHGGGFFAGDDASKGFKKSFGFSPGIVIGDFAFGTNFSGGFGGFGGYGYGGYGHSSYSSSGFGIGFNIGSGSLNVRGTINSGFSSGFGW